MRAALRMVFEKRHVPADKLPALEAVLRDLVTIWQTPGLSEERIKVVHRSLRKAGVKETVRELYQLAGITERLIAAIEALHTPARDALARAGVIGHGPFLQVLREQAARTRIAAKEPIREVGLDRTQDMRPAFVAGLVARGYEEIWGGRAELPVGHGGAPGLEGLIAEVFATLRLRASAKAALRAALKAREQISGQKSIVK